MEKQQTPSARIENLTPKQIVGELNHYIIGQHEAKRAVAIALRNRWRRLQVEGEMQEEITPKNIIMIGPTGIGKTEIARRLAKLAGAPFYKVEASKFTEVGYVGKDVESMVRDLVEIAVSMVMEEERKRVRTRAKELAEERLLDILLPPKRRKKPEPIQFDIGVNRGTPVNLRPEIEEGAAADAAAAAETESKTREKLRTMLREGRLSDRFVDLDIAPRMPPFAGGMPMVEIISAGGSLDDVSSNLRDMLSNFMPQGKKKRSVKMPEAVEILTEEEAARLVDRDAAVKRAIDLVQNNGIIFIDEIDKIASSTEMRGGPDVSREGVQRDILPIVEGTTVSTKYGFVTTNHILFIASGAFHVSKPSDLIPELQGRFPIRVELKPLTEEDLYRILTEPTNSLTKQYQALMATENVNLKFTEDGLRGIAALAAAANGQMENIGARRLHTIMEKVMDEVSFDTASATAGKFVIDGAYVKKCLKGVIEDQDLSRYIL